MFTVEFSCQGDLTSFSSSSECDEEYDPEGGVLTQLYSAWNVIWDTGCVKFYVRGFGEDPWPTDGDIFIMWLLEELPKLLTWLGEASETPFELEFFEPHQERRLFLTHSPPQVRLRLDYMVSVPVQIEGTVSIGTWQPGNEIETIDRNHLYEMLRQIAVFFSEATKTLCRKVYDHPEFQAWMEQCGVV